MTEELIWRIAGGSGDGADSTSQNFARAMMREGLHVFTHQHYPSRIRGGHMYVEVRAAPHEVTSRGDGYNFLLALGDSFARNPQEGAYYGNEERKPLVENLDELRPGGVIVYDAGLFDEADIEEIDLERRAEENDWHVYGLDLRGMAREHGREVMRNTAGVGATAALLGAGTGPFEELMRERMSGDVLEANLNVLEDAHEAASAEEFTHDLRLPEGDHDEQQVLVTGSNGIAYGALDAGCRFVAGYPMTPWTDVFTILSQNLPAFGGVAEQVEDEIAAASLAVGASHAGVKSISGSSGGGFALMSEPLGMAEMTETPVVLVEAMRAGPSTGMPTKTEQADLEHVLYTSQGDSNRVVLAPGNVREAYEATRVAFDVAYGYHVPAIVLYDQKLGAENRTVPESFFDRQPDPDPGTTLTEAEIAEAAHDASGKFHRYRTDPENGVSPRTIPGQKGGRFLASGNEHNEAGHISEDPGNRRRQVDRRLRKMEAIREDLAERDLQTYHGVDNPEYGILCFGSPQGTVEEAVDRLVADGHAVRMLSVGQIAPFPRGEVTQFLEGVESATVVEMNATAQFRGHVQRELGRFGGKLTSLLKYNGNPFEPHEVVEGFEANLTGDASAAPETTRMEPATGD